MSADDLWEGRTTPLGTTFESYKQTLFQLNRAAMQKAHDEYRGTIAAGYRRRYLDMAARLIDDLRRVEAEANGRPVTSTITLDWHDLAALIKGLADATFGAEGGGR